MTHSKSDISGPYDVNIYFVIDGKKIPKFALEEINLIDASPDRLKKKYRAGQ